MPTPRLTVLVPDLFGGGAGRFASELTIALGKRVALDLALFEDAINYPYDGSLYVLSEMHSRGLDRLALLRHLGEVTARFFVLRRRSRPDTVLSLTAYANFVNVLTRARGQRVVVSSRTNERIGNPGPMGAIVRGLVRTLYRRADLVTAVSHGARAELVEHFGVDPERALTLYSALPLERLRAQGSDPLDDDLASIFDRPVVVSVGRLNPEKGSWPLVRAFAATCAPGARLLILGRGIYAKELPERARGLGLSVYAADEPDHPDGPAEACDVVFAGFRARPVRYVARSTVFALPSRWEGLPMALLEALAVGAVCVASDCRYGPREILAPDTDWRIETSTPERVEHGILMPVPSPGLAPPEAPLDAAERAWAETLAEVLADEPLRRHYRARALARSEDFHVDRLLPAWEEALFGAPLSGASRTAPRAR
ncbi:MAG: glycosyltransferase [Sandaracinaceae bacterium]|nr:glycosyltransferase [Sandaracinaceae bacterium]